MSFSPAVSGRERFSSAGRIFACLLLLAFFAGTAGAGVINQGLLRSTANTEADLNLTSVPLNITEASDVIELTWTPAVTGVLYYAVGTPGEDLSLYTPLANPLDSAPGILHVRGDQLPVGRLTCVIVAGNDRSMFFTIIRAAAVAPTVTGPITSSGGMGIGTVTPIFSWEPVTGVPYYHLLISDQPFQITQDAQGTRVEGANIVWQVITPSTSIQYGVSDPSGSFTNLLTPPLVGGTDPDSRPRYNWVVLNNYGNSPAFTSTVVGQVAGFEVEVSSPFPAPELIDPPTGSVLSGIDIQLHWSLVQGASSYLVYVGHIEETAGGSEGVVPVWQVQTTDNAAAMPASALLQNGRYSWKVIAADGQGFGAISDSSSFYYSLESGTLTINTFDDAGNILQFCTIDFEVLDGPGLLPIGTDDAGYVQRDIPLGTYILHASKDGYTEAVSDPVAVTSGSAQTVQLSLSPILSSIIGSVEDTGGSPVASALVFAERQDGTVEQAVTGVSGRFELILDPGFWTLHAERNGYENSMDRTVSLGAGETVDIDDAGGPLLMQSFSQTLSGSVRNGEGEPIHNAEVRAEFGDVVMSGFTDQNGVFSFLVGNGTWTVSAFKAGFYLDSGPQQVIIAGSGGSVLLTLLPQASILSGLVYIDGSPRHEDGLIVRALPSAGDPTVGDVGAGGVFSFGVAPGSYQLEAVLAGYDSSPIDVSMLPGEAISGIRLDLIANTSALFGTTRTPDGSPLSDVTVTTGDVEAVSDASGAFQLTLTRGTHTLVASKDGYSTASYGPFQVTRRDTLTGVVLELAPNAATVSGIVAQGGDGVEEVEVTAEPLPAGSGEALTVITGQGGAYQLGLPAGEWRITAWKSLFLTLPPDTVDLTLQPGAEISGVNFSLTPHSGALTGVVNGGTGPLNGVSVRVSRVDGSGEPLTTVTGVQGRFRLDVEADEMLLVQFSKVGYTPSQVEDVSVAVGDEEELTVTLVAGPASFSGEVTGSIPWAGYWNEPLPGSMIIAEGSEGTFVTQTYETNTYELSLPAGSYSVIARNSGYADQYDFITLVPGEHRRNVNFDLPAEGGSISGQVTDGERGVEGADLSLRHIDTFGDEIRQDLRTGESGYFDFEMGGLGGFDFTLITTADGYEPDTLDLGFVGEGAEMNDVVITLVPLTSGFTGSVTSGFLPMEGVTIRATADNGVRYTALSGSDGGYTLAPAASGTYTIEALKAGYTGESVSGLAVAEHETLTVNLALVENNGVISGLVSASGGAGLQGALVRARSDEGHGAEAITAGNGEYSLGGLYPGTTYTLIASLPGYEQATRTDVATGESVDFTLSSNNLHLAGRTVNQVSSPVPNVPLRAASLADGSEITLVSGDDGSFEFTNLSRNAAYRIQSLYNQDGFDEVDIALTTGENDTSGIFLTLLQRDAVISGNAGEAGVSLHAVRDGGGSAITFSGNDGSFILENLREGDWTITPSRQGTRFTPASLTVTGLGIGEERTGVEFTADRATVFLSGYAEDETGAALAGWTVQVSSEGFNTHNRTFGDGFFSVRVPGYTTYAIYASPPEPGWAPQPLEVVTENEDISDLALVAEAMQGRISGSVTDAETADSIQTFFLQVDSGAVRQLSGGAYVVDSLSRGSHLLSFSASGYSAAELTVNLSSGRDQAYRGVALTPLEAGLYLRLYRLEEEDRIPVPGALVILVDQDGQRVDTTTTTTAGLAAFSGLDTGRLWGYEVEKAGFTRSTAAGFTPSNTPLDVQLNAAPGYILGRVTGLDGQTVEGAVVQAFTGDGTLREEETDQQGSYALLAPSGPIAVIAFSPDGATSSYVRNLELEAGTAATLNFTLRRTAELVGRVTSAGGNVNRARFGITQSGGGVFSYAWTGEDGWYRLRGIPPGSYFLRVTAEGYEEFVPPPMSLGTVRVDTVNVTLTSQTTAIVGRTVLAGTEQGIAGVEVRLEQGGVPLDSAVTGGDGGFSFLDLPAGSYALEASRFGYDDVSQGSIFLPAGLVLRVSPLEFHPTAGMVSGWVLNDQGEAREGIALQLIDLADGGSWNTDTDSAGRYQFTAIPASEYRLSATDPAGGDLGPPEYRVVVTDTAGAADLNFVHTPARGTANVTGVLTYRGAGVEGVEVNLRKLGSTERMTATTVSGGGFTFTGATTPGNYRLSASDPAYGETASPVFTLETNVDRTIDLVFAGAQVAVALIDEEAQPVTDHLVSVTSVEDGSLYLLVTNANGRAETEAKLPAGEYRVFPEPLEGYLPPEPVAFDLAQDQRVDITMPIGFPLAPPPPSGSLEDSFTVSVEIPAEYEIEDAVLYYTNIGESGFQSTPMNPVPPPGGGGAMRGPRELTPLPGIRRLRRGGTAVKIARPMENVIYQASIPPQSGSGTVSFYPELVTTEGLVIGGESAMSQIQVFEAGVLNSVVISPPVNEVQPGVPLLLEADTYDEAGTDIADLLAENGSYTWSASTGLVEAVPGEPAKTIYLNENEGIDTVRVLVSQPSEGAHQEAILPLESRARLLGSLSISAPDVQVAAGSSILLSTTAFDTGGVVMHIAPEWSIADTNLGELESVEFTQQARFTALPDHFGTVAVIARDSFTGKTAQFNSGDGESGGGLAVYRSISSAPGDTFFTEDGRGVEVRGVFAANAPAGQVGELSMRIRKLSAFQRGVGNTRTLADSAYRILLNGDLAEEGITYSLSLPLPPGFASRNPRIARWDTDELSWMELGGVVDEDLLGVTVSFAGTEESVDGLFTVLVDALPLGLENLVFTPNPFSPESAWPLSIEFTLHSLHPDVWMTIEIYNMAGQHVRTLLDRELLEPGRRYSRDSRPLLWDGRTDSGRMARNGRYLVHITAEDVSGEEEEFATVVLVK